jgi:transcriptional regulator with XRE-family HTH domain
MKNTAENAHKCVATTVWRLRGKRGWTQAQLAKYSGVCRRFVRDLEGGRKPSMRMDKVNDVLAVFDYHLEAVADRETNP